MTEDETVGWHHQHSEHGFEQALGVVDGQGSLACCTSRSHKKSDTTERLNRLFIAVTSLVAEHGL